MQKLSGDKVIELGKMSKYILLHTTSLIEEVKKHPVLYDINYPFAKPPQLIERSWMEIEGELRIEPGSGQARYKRIKKDLITYLKNSESARLNLPEQLDFISWLIPHVLAEYRELHKIKLNYERQQILAECLVMCQPLQEQRVEHQLPHTAVLGEYGHTQATQAGVKWKESKKEQRKMQQYPSNNPQKNPKGWPRTKCKVNFHDISTLI